MRLGIGSYTFTWAAGVPGHPPKRPMNALALLRRAVELEVRVVQFCDNLPLVALPRQELEEVAGFARERGIALELGTRGIKDCDTLLAHLNLARQLGSPFLRVVVDSRGDEPSPSEVVDRLRPLMPAFVSAGIKLAIENHDRFSSSDLAEIVERLGPSQAGICLDTVNSFGALEGPELVVQTLAPYTLNLHVKDFTIRRVPSQMGFVVSGCPAGTGRLNVPWVLEELRRHKRDCNAILELWTPLEPELESTIETESRWASESVAWLRKLIPD
jgi:sugar phosphate isomerase/epimerase